MRVELTTKAGHQASIHAIIESDDRVTFVVENLDDAIAELDRLDAMFKVYQAQLNVGCDSVNDLQRLTERSTPYIGHE